MLHVLALLAATAVEPTVSTAWLASHLNDPQVRVITTGTKTVFDAGHIPGARFIDHMETLGGAEGHHLLPPADLARALTKAGAADGTHIVIYGDRPMETGWLFMTLAATGHAADVSMLDGNFTLWQQEGRPASTNPVEASTGTLTAKPAPDVIVDAPWVKGRLQSTATKVLDVRTTGEWNNGHLPNATLILWQDLYADQKTAKLKSPEEIRALIARAGVGPN